nr:phosphoribosylanthranilate isomerase [Erythrobacter litoralis]
MCGISTPQSLDAAIEARADFVGFVFFPPSPRNVGTAESSMLGARAGSKIRRVGLFVDPDDNLLSHAIAAGSLDAIQLHGSESPRRTAEIRERYGVPVWKAISVAAAQDVARAEQYRDTADLILFDAKTPKDANMPGGMGLRFDWSLLAPWVGRSGWGLAGGLTTRNVRDAIAQARPPLIDTSSGVETAPGIKDSDLIRAFCTTARNA